MNDTPKQCIRCKECRDGKHANCTLAYDLDKDEYTKCQCDDREHLR